MLSLTSGRKRVLTFLVLIFVLASVSVAADPSLRAWYKFNETSGTAVADSSGNGFDTVITADTTPNWNPDGAFGGCLEGDGQWTGMCIDVPSGVFSTVSTEITVAWWAQLTANTAGGAFFTGNNGTNVLKAAPYPHKTGDPPVIDDWYETWSVGSTTTNWWWGYGDETVNEWHHMAIVYDTTAGTKKLYFNGEVKGNVAIAAGESLVGINAFRLFSRSRLTFRCAPSGLMTNRWSTSKSPTVSAR